MHPMELNIKDDVPDPKIQFDGMGRQESVINGDRKCEPSTVIGTG